MLATKTKKGAASIYIVIFTTTLLGVIALSFVRIMIAESSRTTNYSLSQSAYNSALAGVEDAKIVLLRYQNCIAANRYASATGTGKDCSSYINKFSTSDTAHKTAKDCDTVGQLLHPGQNQESNQETVIQTTDSSNTQVIDQAYTCVKISAYTEDFLAVLKEDSPTKLVPLRTENDETQKSINRIQVQWFDQDNYNNVLNSNNALSSGFSGIGKGALTTPATPYGVEYSNAFTENAVVPPVLQVSYVQTAKTFNVADFYASEGIGNTSRTNRGTLLLRPSNNGAVATAHKVSTSASGNHSNLLPQNSIAYSANKSFNTPVDVYCNGDPSSFANWGTYACSADFFVPDPIGSSSSNSRSSATNFLVLNLPYGAPETDIAVKMYSCVDANQAIDAKVDDPGTGKTRSNCKLVEFANVQPMVDSTGRANDLFRRVESRIELADTNFPIANYALAVDGDSSSKGISKSYYVTNNCSYSSSTFKSNDVYYETSTNTYNSVLQFIDGYGNPGTVTCANAGGGNNGE